MQWTLVGAALTGLVVGTAGCAGGGPVTAEGSDRYPNATAEDWVTYADHVVIATAVDDEALPLDGEDEANGEGSVDRMVTMRVDDVVWTSADPRHDAPTTFEWSGWGWSLQDGERIEMTGADEPRVEVDHTYVMALVYEPGFTDGGTRYPASWRGLGSDSVIPYDGTELGVGEVQGSVRSKPPSPDPDAVDHSLDDEMTGKRVDELVTALNDATPGTRGDFGPVWRTNG
ncbi:hypothetical protein [Promicromonospora sp. NPDC019610]|uniref:hypothetical protein n=1 Tax=Promicromonospora sp. NPDC019610 TaxID=3364405 RepID=UPI003798A763